MAVPTGHGVISSAAQGFSPSLLREARARVVDLRGDGRLTPELSHVIETLLDQAEAHVGVLSRCGEGGAGRDDYDCKGVDEVASPSAAEADGWAHLPAPLAEALFSGMTKSIKDLSTEDLGSDNYEGGWTASCDASNLAACNLVCRGWKRAVTKHCRVLSVKLDLEHTVPVWANNLGQTFAGVKRLKLDGRKQYPSAIHPIRANLGLGSILAQCDLEELSVFHLFSDADLEDIPTHAANLQRLRLASPITGDDPALDAAYPSRDSALRILGKLTSLRALEIGFLGRVQLSASWNALSSLTQLQELTFLRKYVGLKDAISSLCPQLIGLKKLTLPVPLTARIATSVLGLTNLQYLHTQDPADLFGVMPILAPHPALRSISLSGSRLSSSEPEDAVGLSVPPPGPRWSGQQLSQISRLEIADTAYPRYFPATDAFSNLAKLFPRLTMLTLKRTQIQGDSLHQLADLTGLRELTLLHVDISTSLQEPGLKALKTLRRLMIKDVHKGLVTQLMQQLPLGLEDLCVHCGYGTGVQGLSEESTVGILLAMKQLKSATLHGIIDWDTAAEGLSLAVKRETGVPEIAICLAKAALPNLQHLDCDRVQFPWAASP